MLPVVCSDVIRSVVGFRRIQRSHGPPRRREAFT
jgi:hypothetical protein